MNFNLVPSLEHIALVRIANIVATQDNIKAVMATPLPEPPFCNVAMRSGMQDSVIEKISQLSLPRPLEKELVYLVQSVVSEMLNWRKYHQKILPKTFIETSLSKLCWTQRGTVDRKGTAETLVKSEDTSIFIRYNLACTYCLELDIPELVAQTNERLRYCEECEPNLKTILERLRHQASSSFIRTHDKAGNPVNHWKKRFGECSYEDSLVQSIQEGNKTTTEYFLRKLTPKKIKESLIKFAREALQKRWCLISTIPVEYYSEVFCFLFSEMSEEQQALMFKLHSYEILKCFLDWPLQNLFLRMMTSMWSFLSKNNFYHILCSIVAKEIYGYKDFNYRQVFGEVWEQSPNDYKKYVINTFTSCSELLFRLFRMEDKSNILLILKDATIKEKEELLFSYQGMNICLALLRSYKAELLNVFVGECVSSKNMANKLRDEFKKHVIQRLDKMLQEEKNMWHKCFIGLLRRNRNETRKRNLSGENDNPSKKLCNKHSKK